MLIHILKSPIILIDIEKKLQNLTTEHETIQAATDDNEQKMFAYAIEAQRELGKNEMGMNCADFSF